MVFRLVAGWHGFKGTFVGSQGLLRLKTEGSTLNPKP